MDDKILFLYAQGMAIRAIARTLKELYSANASPSLTSKSTASVIEHAIEWQSRQLDAAYLLAYLDCIALKIRQDKQVINKSIYLALAVNMVGR